MRRTSPKFCLLLITVGLFLLLGPVASTQIGPGTPLPNASAFSDQKIGSVLIYNLYTSSATDPNGVNTDLSLTNTSTTAAATVHLFFVNSANGRAADTFVALGPKQTMSLLASDYDPGVTGYAMAVAVDSTTGCPINFNFLTGDAYVKLASGHVASLGAQAVAAFYSSVLAGCSGASTSAILNFDENTASGYNRLPRALMVDNIPSRANLNDTLLVYNRIGGSFVQGSGVSTTGTLFGVLFDDAENPYSFSLNSSVQVRSILSDGFARTIPRLSSIIPFGRSGWMKFFNPTTDAAITGAIINRNTQIGSSSLAYEGGHNLRALSLAGNNTLTIPVSPPTASEDLTVSLNPAHNVFNVGTPGSFTVTVTNNGTKAATGTISIISTLPNFLTLASGSGTGWTCTGTGTANVNCTNVNGLAGGGATLPALTLNVNVGAGTPVGSSVLPITVRVANAGDNNPLNNQATDNADVTGFTATTTTIVSSLPVSTFGNAVTFTATAAAAAGTPSGTVDFFDGTTLVAPAIPVSGGVALFTTSSLAVGFHTLNAVYSGDASFAGSRNSSGVLQTVNAVSRTATTTTVVSSLNPSVLTQTVNLTATVSGSGGPPTGTVQFFDGALSLGTRTLSAGSATLSIATLVASAHAITVQYLGDPNFAPSSTASALTQTVTQSDVGLAYSSANQFSDQKPGSVLIYNYYTSATVNGFGTNNTDFSITNTSTSSQAAVHLFFVNAANGRAADTFISLQPNQTMSFLASDYDPGITGYMVAVAVDGMTGCPIGFNNLVGDAFIKQPSGHRANLPAQAVAALFSGPLGGGCGSTATLAFDGSTYNLLPRTLLADNLPSRADSNDTFLVVNRIAGNFVQGSSAVTTGALFGLLYDDAETAYSFSLPGSFQVKGSLSSNFPRSVPRYDSIIPAGRSGYLKVSNPNSDFGLTGAVINFNSLSASRANAFNSGHNLRALTLTNAASFLQIPVSSPTASVDLMASMTHSGFNAGSAGSYTITVTNVGNKAATGTISVYDNLPNFLTLASASGTGWTCSGTGTATVACTNTSGLAGGNTSLPPLTLNVNAGAATPGGTLLNSAVVSNAGDNNPLNDTANDTATMTTFTPTTTALTSSLPVSTLGNSVTFTATVTAAAGTPTGTVEFFDGASSLGMQTLSGGVAMLSTAGLSVGVHTISAVYTPVPANGFADSRNAGLAQTVNAVSRTVTTTMLTTSPNPSVVSQVVSFSATVSGSGGPPTGSVEFFIDGVSIGARALVSGATSVAFPLSIGTHSITAQYLGNPNFAPSSSVVSQVVNNTDVGLPYSASAEHGDQKPGSVLIYNLYRSSTATPATDNTDLSLTNLHPTQAVTVHLFFVRGASGIAADTFLTLQPNQTKSLLASDFDPDATGYVVAVAVDAAGCPSSFNFLMGDAYVKQPSGHRAALSAQTFAARYSGTLAGCSGSSATLNFDGVSYDRLPRVLSLNNLPSSANGNNTQLVLNRIGGNLLLGNAADPLGTVNGLLYDDAENAASFSFMAGSAQSISTFSPNVSSGRSGWAKYYTATAAGLTGAAFIFNPAAGSLASAFNGGVNLTTQTLADPISLVIPVFPATAAADLTITKSHSGSFTLGSTGVYNIVVSNAPGTKSVAGTIRVTDTLPGNLTLASFSGTGWSCTGTGTANVVCSNTNGLAAGSSLPLLTLTVAVNTGTPLTGVTNMATVALTPPQETNTSNNTAQDPTAIVCPTILLSPGSLLNGVAGSPYSQTFSATPNSPTYTFGVTAGALPPGLTLNPNGVLSGTPTTAGTYNFTVTATGFGVCAVAQMYALVIDCPAITLLPNTVPGGTVGTAYNQTISANPSGTTYTFALTGGALPPGLSLDNSGLLSGSPTAAGNYSFTITATGFGTCVSSITYTSVVVCPAITLAPPASGTAGTAYSQSLSASPAGGAPYAYTQTGGVLPPGLTLSSSGLLSGTPTTAGTFTASVTVAGFNSACAANLSLSVTILCPTLTLGPASLPDGQLGTAYNQTVSAGPVGTAYSYAVTSGVLPTGLALNGSTGAITGTPSAGGNYAFAITATGWGSCTVTRSYQILIAATCGTITLNPSSLPTGTLGAPYNQTLTATGGTAPYTFSLVSGTLPAGLSLASNGVVSGTPTAANTAIITVKATGQGGCTGQRTYVLIINCATITLNPLTLPNGTTGLFYSQTLTASPAAAYTFSLSGGSLPPGFTLNNTSGVLSGTSSTTGTYTFTIRAAVGSCSATRQYTISIN